MPVAAASTKNEKLFQEMLHRFKPRFLPLYSSTSRHAEKVVRKLQTLFYRNIRIVWHAERTGVSTADNAGYF